MRKTLVLSMVVTVFLMFSALAPAFEFIFEVFEFPDAHETYVYGINNHDEIAGLYTVYTADDDVLGHGFIYSKGNFTTFDFPGVSYITVIMGISDNGEVVGYYYRDISDPGHGFQCGQKGCNTIDYPGAYCTSAMGINEQGVIVGAYLDDPSGFPFGFIYENGIYTALDFPDAIGTSATSINDRGDIAGFYYDNALREHGFLYFRGEFTTLDYPDSRLTSINSINNDGQIVGQYWDDGAQKRRTFIYYEGVYHNVDYPDSYETLATGINDRGVIVGSYTTSFPGILHGFKAKSDYGVFYQRKFRPGW